MMVSGMRQDFRFGITRAKAVMPSITPSTAQGSQPIAT